MRLVTGVALVSNAVALLQSEPSFSESILGVLEIGAAALLSAGLWTPVSGTLVAIIGLLSVVWRHADLWGLILMGTMGIALALLGPGAWSVDAKLFGLKRIDIPDSKR